MTDFNPEEVNLEKFDPTKAKLISLVEEVKDLKIKDVDDTSGYAILFKAQQSLKKMSAGIKATAKDYRSDAIKFQKAVIAEEKGMLEVITPTLGVLTERRAIIDNQKETLKRAELVPERRIKLQEVATDLSDAEIMDFSDTEFSEYVVAKKEALIEAREQKILDDEKKLQVEKEKNEAEEARLLQVAKDKVTADEAEKKARENAIEQAKLDALKAEADKKAAVDNAVQDEKDKAKRLEDNRKENERIVKKQEEAAEEEAARLKALAPEKEKLVIWAGEVLSLEPPKVESEEALEILKRYNYAIADLKADLERL